MANSLLCTINSSCNFAFYCGDVVFRECLSAISKTKWKQTSAIAKCCKSQSATSANHEINLGIEEETDRENPNQILVKLLSKSFNIYYLTYSSSFEFSMVTIIIIFFPVEQNYNADQSPNKTIEN